MYEQWRKHVFKDVVMCALYTDRDIPGGKCCVAFIPVLLRRRDHCRFFEQNASGFLRSHFHSFGFSGRGRITILSGFIRSL